MKTFILFLKSDAFMWFIIILFFCGVLAFACIRYLVLRWEHIPVSAKISNSFFAVLFVGLAVFLCIDVVSTFIKDHKK